GGDRVGEGRRLGIGEEDLDLGGAQGDALLERRREGGELDRVPRRDAAVGARPRREQRIGLGGGGEPRDLGARGGVGLGGGAGGGRRRRRRGRRGATPARGHGDEGSGDERDLDPRHGPGTLHDGDGPAPANGTQGRRGGRTPAR